MFGRLLTCLLTVTRCTDGALPSELWSGDVEEMC